MTDEPFDWVSISQEVDQERGRYLSAMCMIELLVDSVLLAFFEVPAFRKQQLARGSLLSTIGLKSKLDTLGYILKATGLDEEFAPTLSQLRSANELRNVLAHAAIGPGIGGEITKIYAMQFKRGRPARKEVSLRQLKSRVADVNGLSHAIISLQLALGALPSGDDGMAPF